MKRLLTLAVLLISTVPVYAQGQQPNVAKLKADAQRVIGIIGGDKAKMQTYCQIAELSEQLDEVDQEKDSKTANALLQKMDELQKKLGPEVVALLDGLKDVDPNSRDGQEIASIIESLDESCQD
jgi:predicted transcriptional regulator